MVCYNMTIFGRDTIWNLRVQINQNIEKIAFKVVKMKFLAMHITNKKLSVNIFMVGNLQNIFMEHDLYLIYQWFLALNKIDNFDTYNVFLVIATNILQWLKTGFMVQGHIVQRDTRFLYHTHTHTHWSACDVSMRT